MKKRFILVGFDGCNPEMIERLLPNLPNFRRLIENGCWGPMLSTIPADTPTNWTALATGATAATSKITGFAFHRPGESLTIEGKPNAKDYPEFRAAEFIWEAADRQGLKSLIINYPFAWHSAELKHAVIVGGDQIQAGICQMHKDGCLCSRDRLEAVEQGTPIELQPDADGFAASVTFRQSEPITLRTRPGSPAQLTIEDADGNALASLTEGQWTDYLAIDFGDEIGYVRFMLAHLSDDGSSVQVFHSMISRGTGWTKPAEYAPRLTEACGPYQQCEETGGPMGRHGWVGEYDVEAYTDVLRTTGNILTSYAKRLMQDVPDWDHMYLQMHANDSHSHRMLGHLLPELPLATPESTAFARRMIRENYIETDRILGDMAALAEESNALLMVVSDHSAIPTHTWVDTGRPFVEKSWLAFDAEGKWDPARSKVRHMINHSIYINLEGRQSDGIVEPEDYEAVRDETISTLMSMRDPKTGACPIAIAARREDMDGVGGNGDGFGDVIYFMRPGYTNQPGSEATQLTGAALSRVSDPAEALATGYTAHEWIQGNHHDYLPNAEYPGFGSNRAVLLVHGPGAKQGYAIRRARTIDVTPTLAYYTGMKPPAQVEGHALVELFEE